MCFELPASLVCLQRPSDHVDLMDLPTVGMQMAARPVIEQEWQPGPVVKEAKKNKPIVLSVGATAHYRQA